MRGHRPLAPLVCVVALAGAVVPAAGQKAPLPNSRSLDQVEALVEAGRAEDARSALLAWWSEGRSGAPTQDLQRGLWLRARLTVDPTQAALDYRRLAVEYPGGPYSAEALLRLAQASWTSGDSAEAAGELRRLDREYPGSHVRDEARAWLAAAGPPPPPPPASTASTGRYAVQLGAFSTEARASTLQQRVQGTGFEARLVRIPGSALVRVRVGHYGSESAADEVRRRLVGLGFTAAVVPDANREEPIGK
jgi:SPOR domain